MSNEYRNERAAIRHRNQEVDSYEDYKDEMYMTRLRAVAQRRYLLRKPTYRKRKSFDWEDIISEDSETYSEEEFQQLFRMSRSSFKELHNKIKDHRIFQIKNTLKRKARDSWKQLLVFLYRLGKEGNGGTSKSVGSFFRIAHGSVVNYIRNVIQAIMSIKHEYLRWHTDEEKENMKVRCGVSKGFFHCVGIIDGTLVFFNSKPQLDGEAYFTRKGGYAINVMVVCDDVGKILYLYGGWPGSAHDNRVWKNCRLFTKREEYFGDRDYLIGDAAFSASPIMVQSFKKDARTGYLSPEKEFFNTKLGSLRIKSEHCIGMLKGRFPCLRRVSGSLKNAADMKYILQLVESSAILHNFLLQKGDFIDQSWFDEINDSMDIDDSGDGGDEYDIRGAEYDRRESVFFQFLIISIPNHKIIMSIF